jgi:hypothetical protein
METVFDIKQKFPPVDQPITGHLGKFVIAFVQALLKIGHFQSSDAKATAAKAALFSEWQYLVPRDREVSFIVRHQEGQQPRIFVYGILSEIAPLANLFSPDMADLFTPKFVDFFMRHYLSGVTLKPKITLKEIEGFIEIIREPINAADMEQGILDVTAKLVRDQIVHATLIYEKEMPEERRSLHFMAQMGLIRLDKELRMIPLYPHLTHEEKIALKVRVFHDLLIPLSDVAVLKEILVRCDSIIPSGWEDRLEMEREIGKAVGNPLLWKFLSESAETLKAVPSEHGPSLSESDRLAYDRLIFIVRKIVSNLSLAQMEDGSEEALERLLQEKVISLMEIPDSVLERLYLMKKVNDYFQNKTRYWEENQAKWDAREQNPLIPILPVLLKRNEFESFGELIAHIKKTWSGTAGGDSDFMVQIGMEAMQEAVLSKLRDRQIENRKELFVVLEDNLVSIFFRQSLLPLCADDDILLRRHVCSIIACGGELAASDLLAYGKDPVRNWQSLRNVVMMLGDIGSSSEMVMAFLKRCHRHPNTRVREEVVISLGKIKGPEAEKILLKELDNPDKTHLADLILTLGDFDPVNPRTLMLLQETLKKKRKNDAEPDTLLQVHCCLAAEAIARVNPSSVESLVPILCDAITPDKPGFFGIVMEKHHEKAYEVKRAICHLLGEIGTKEAFPLVGRLITEKYWHHEDNAAMHLALQKIERRISLG